MADIRVVLDKAADLVAERRMTMAELTEALIGSTGLSVLAEIEGLPPQDYLDEEMIYDPRFWHEDGWVIRLDLRIDALVLTHRLTAEEIATDTLTVLGDLQIFDSTTPSSTTNGSR